MGNTGSSQRSASINDYNIYDRGYRSGASTSIFVGPIWVEEALSVQIKSGSGDVPLYSYAGTYYDRTLVGRYIVRGTIAVAYTRPDYLLSIISQAQDISIQDETLRNMIESRRSQFEQTLQYRELVRQGLTSSSDTTVASVLENSSFNYITSYVNRISREIELMNMESSTSGRRSFNPTTFELTIIRGNIYDDTQTIDIYQNARIIGAGYTDTNDDNPSVEFYDFIAQRKPPRVVREQVPEIHATFIRSNLMQMASEITSSLLDSVLAPPQVRVFSTDNRTKHMTSTDNLAIAGLLNPRMRFYGKGSQFIEVVYALEYDRTFSTMRDPDDRTRTVSLRSRTPLQYRVRADGQTEWTTRTSPSTFLQPPAGTGTEPVGFDNCFGSLIAIDRRNTAKFISATGPVRKVALSRRIGGSVVSPRYERNEFAIGSFIPPTILDEGSFSYADSDVETLTYSTLWCCLTGMRGTGQASIRIESDQHERDQTYITEVAQPIFTFAYIEKVTGRYSEDEATISISAPYYVDYMHLEKNNRYGKRAEPTAAQRLFPTERPVISFKYNTGGLTISAEGGDDATRVALEDAVLTVYHDVHDLPDPSETPQCFLFEAAATGASQSLATNFSKCLYVLPLIFLEEGERGAITQVEETMVGDYFQAAYTAESLPSEDVQKLAYFLGKEGAANLTCSGMEFNYDWTLADASGYNVAGQSIKIRGMYSLLSKTLSNATTGPGGEALTWGEDIYVAPFNEASPTLVPAKKVHVFWVIAILPIVRGVEQQNAGTDTEDLRVLHDISASYGRYVELYNITRCDVLTHDPRTFDILSSESEPDWSMIWSEDVESQLTNFRNIWRQVTGTVGNWVSGAWTSIAGALRNSFSELIAIFAESGVLNGVYTSTNMRMVAAFLRGYAFRIDVRRIVDQLLKCRIDPPSGVTIPHGNGTEFTLSWALSQCDRSSSSSTPTDAPDGVNPATYAELSSMVGDILSQKINSLGVRVVEAGPTGITFAERDLITPAPNVVTFGLTSEGYETLIATRDANLRYSTSAVAGGSIELGGYDA
jgi:hypothetical protein